MNLERRGKDPVGATREALHALTAAIGSADQRAQSALQTLRTYFDPTAAIKAQRLARAAGIVSASLDYEASLRQALLLAVDVMQAERGFLMLAEERRIATVLDPTHNPEHPVEEGAPREIAERVIESGEAFFNERTKHPPLAGVVPLHARSIACVPLRVRGEMLGAIYVDARAIPGLFSNADRELLIAFAHQAALAIVNARLFERERGRVARIAELQGFQDRLLEAIANGVLTIDAAGIVRTFNRAAETTFGLPAAEVVGMRASEMAQRIDDFDEFLRTFFESGASMLRAETGARKADGTQLVLELRLAPLDFENGVGAAVVVTDVTQQRARDEVHAAEMARAEAIQESFKRYLAPHVLESLVKDPACVRLGGERRRSTMLFADIRGFTSLAATLSAERVVEILNTYFEEAVRILFEHDGLLDKFYGDGLMAVFGAPRAREDDAARAVAAAIRLQDAVRDELAARLEYPLAISIGLATGDVVAGHVGSQRRMDYTVIGDAVNLAQGLQSAAPAGCIYLDEATYQSAAPPLTRTFHRIGARVKGRSDLVPAYAMMPAGVLGATGS